MTLCLIAMASDGFLAIADGRRARLTAERGVYEWISDDEIKVVQVPDLPIVALTAGRATFDQESVAAVLSERFARLRVPHGDGRVLAVAEACRSTFTVLDEAYPGLNHVGTTTIIAGYEAAGEFAAFQVDVPKRVLSTGSNEVTFDLAAINLEPTLPVFANPARSEAGLDVVGAFDRFFDEAESDVLCSAGIAPQYRFAGHKLDEMRAEVIDLLQNWLIEKSSIVAADAIGGRWVVASVRPGRPVEMGSPVPLGPFGGP